jgi:hypothetical protein
MSLSRIWGATTTRDSCWEIEGRSRYMQIEGMDKGEKGTKKVIDSTFYLLHDARMVKAHSRFIQHPVDLL